VLNATVSAVTAIWVARLAIRQTGRSRLSASLATRNDLVALLQ